MSLVAREGPLRFAPRSREAVAAFIEAWEQSWAEGSQHRFANLGYWVRSDAAGRGYATAVTRLLADFGFRELGLTRLELVIEPGNVASQRVAEKAGAAREGLLRNRLVVNGQARDAVMYGLVPP